VSASDGGPFASVAVPIPVRRLFTYRVGDALRGSIRRGTRVRVPFGRRKVVGTVVEWPAAPPDAGVETRTIDEVAHGARRLPEEILELTRFVADYYLCSWGEAIEAALPPNPGPGRVRRFVRRRGATDVETLPARATARRRLLALLPDDGTEVPLSALTVADRRVVRSLRDLGLVDVLERRAAEPPREAPANVAPAEPGFEPTPAQADVLDELRPAIEAGKFAPFLLYGATGSGKTEVYLRAARETLDRGRGVLYLVPEIGLTPLLAGKIERRFPGTVALLHSELGARQRDEAWRQIRDGRRRLVVGTRSALFSPIADLGLIVVDEEQDGSYKQGESPRYNARDMAIVRARSAAAVVLLGSATPSVESFQHAVAGRYRLLRLGGRVENRPLPAVTLIDMRLEFARAGEITPVSTELVKQLRECVARGEQALVLRNRRGWAAAILCPDCGQRIACTRCSIAMTWHRSAQRLCCHYCGDRQRMPQSCPRCGAEHLDEHGEGTERIEDLLAEAVPGARIERMDRDTVRGRGAHERLLRRFDRGEIDVLVGTQMIAKGHDFHRVTVVGVLSADHALGLPDFRAGERVFQLLTQVAGRAGRGERLGRVVIQAFDPDHPLLRQAARQDYEAFFGREIRYRRALRYPPFAALVQIIVHDREEFHARQWADELARALESAGDGKLIVGGPGPAPIERLKGRYRQQILVRTAGRRRLIAAVDQALDAVGRRVPRRAIQVDVDPYSLL